MNQERTIRRLGGAMVSNIIDLSSQPVDDKIIVTTLVEDFDEKLNKLKEDPMAQSRPADKYCTMCLGQVVMSLYTLELIKKMELQNKRFYICCTRCGEFLLKPKNLVLKRAGLVS